jgi:hypothetical protein
MMKLFGTISPMSMRMRKLPSAFIFAILACTCSLAHAQCKLRIHATDSLAFTLFIQGENINLRPCTDIALPNVASGKLIIKAVLIDNRNCEQSLTLKDQMAVEYELREVKGMLKFFLIGEAPWNIQNPMVDSVTVVQEIKQQEPTNDKCQEVFSPEEMESLKMKLRDEHFEAKKLALMEKNLGTKCVRVDQLRYLLSNLELEENKMQLAEHCLPRMYDPARIALIEDDFFLAKNKEKIKWLIQNHKP